MKEIALIMHSKNNEYIELYFSLISVVSQAKVIIKTFLYLEHKERYKKMDKSV